MAREQEAKRVGDVISDAVGEMVTGWVLLATSITNEGEQATW